jgi:hypothetical protein
MKRSNTETHKFDYQKALHIIFFATMMISCLLNNSLAQADSLIPSDYRLATAGDKFSDTVQFAVAFKFRPPRRLRAKRMELVVGTIATSQESRLFVSLGPVWQLPIVNRSMFFELGISPTFIGGSSFNQRDMGGNFHFTSFAAVGARFGKRDALSLSLRVQHTSNGGLNSTNPGMNMIGINIAFNSLTR